MRYTTIIDITEQPDVWRSVNARTLYFWLCCRCGYHDDDRDKLVMSTRSMGAALGMTHAAVRHALHVLTEAGLVKVTCQDRKTVIMVTKFVQERSISARPKKSAITGSIDQYTQNTTKVNGFLDYWKELEKRAKKGDAEAAAAMQRYRGIYEAQMKKSS